MAAVKPIGNPGKPRAGSSTLMNAVKIAIIVIIVSVNLLLARRLRGVEGS